MNMKILLSVDGVELGSAQIPISLDNISKGSMINHMIQTEQPKYMQLKQMESMLLTFPLVLNIISYEDRFPDFASITAQDSKDNTIFIRFFHAENYQMNIMNTFIQECGNRSAARLTGVWIIERFNNYFCIKPCRRSQITPI